MLHLKHLLIISLLFFATRSGGILASPLSLSTAAELGAGGGTASLQLSQWDHAFLKFDLHTLTTLPTKAILRVYYENDAPL